MRTFKVDQDLDPVGIMTATKIIFDLNLELLAEEKASPRKTIERQSTLEALEASYDAIAALIEECQTKTAEINRLREEYQQLALLSYMEKTK